MIEELASEALKRAKGGMSDGINLGILVAELDSLRVRLLTSAEVSVRAKLTEPEGPLDKVPPAADPPAGGP